MKFLLFLDLERCNLKTGVKNHRDVTLLPSEELHFRPLMFPRRTVRNGYTNVNFLTYIKP